jgi:signal transduction histidine kinase
MNANSDSSLSLSGKKRPAANWVVSGGEMGELIRSLDWSKTPLGPIESWPQSLRTALSICLSSQFPTVIYWGTDYAMLYNDGYAQILGTKHPWALGKPVREVWSEIWHINGPMLNQVLSSGVAAWAEDKLLNLHRRGYLEECYFTYSFTPVLVETGIPGGIFCDCQETTERVIAERRLRLLRELSDTAAGEKTAEGACKSACEVLTRYTADVTFALLYLLEPGDNGATLAGATGLPPGQENAPVRLVPESTAASFRDAPGGTPPSGGSVPGASGAGAHDSWPLASLPRSLKKQVVQLPTDAEGSPWPEAGHTAVLLPIAGTGEQRPYGLLVAGLSPRRALDDGYRAFLDLVAGQIATAITSARAYEEEKRRAERLAEVDRAKTAFFSNVSHEFRTPLTLILGPLTDELAEQEAALPPARRQRIEAAHRNSLRLLKLVNTLLDFARIEAGRVQAVYEPTDLARFTADLAGSFRSACDRAGLSLKVDCPPLPEPVHVDREMWEKIVLNLLSNAFKFTLAGGIAVSLKAAGDAVELAVRDTGVGISPGELPRVFDRFYRVKGTEGRTHEGTGIGLALVRELVALHGGRIRAASVPGRESTFTVSLPRGTAHLPAERLGAPRTMVSTALGAGPYVEEALSWLPAVPVDSRAAADEKLRPEHVPADTAESLPPLSAQGPRPRILWADDNADMRDYVRRLLGGRYEVEAVADGQEAIEAARREAPDLVLADVMMPRLDGFGLLHELRADERTRALPVILLSARAGEEARIEGLKAGADSYLVKPFSARELLAVVGAQIEMARMRGEAEELRRGLAKAQALQAANIVLRDSRRAALNLMEDAVAARRQAEQVSAELRQTEAQLREAQAKLQAHAEELEKTVASRTARLHETIAELEHFSYAIVHDLRAPLRAMQGFAEMIEEECATCEHTLSKEFFRRIKTASRRMDQLIADSLSYSKAARQELTLEPVDLFQLLDGLVQSYPNLHPDKADIRLDPNLPTVLGNEAALTQCFSNLLGNAVKFAKAGVKPQIRVWAELAQGRKTRESAAGPATRNMQLGAAPSSLDTRPSTPPFVRIWVEDNGIGIPNACLPRIFDIFQRASKDQEGTGIGLAIVRKVAQRMGGEVGVESEEAKGSRFWVELAKAP